MRRDRLSSDVVILLLTKDRFCKSHCGNAKNNNRTAVVYKLYLWAMSVKSL